MRFLFFFAFLNISFNSFASGQDDPNDNDPYSGAMGDISIYSVYAGNPSLSTLIECKRLNVSFKNHYWTNELNSWRCSFSSPSSWLATGISLSGYGYEHYNYFHIGGDAGKDLSSSLAMGIGVDVYSLYYTGCDGRKNNLTIRIGAVFTPEKKFLFSCWIANPFQTGFYNQTGEKEKLPVQISSGFRLLLTEETRWSVEIENSDFSRWKVKTGFEYEVKPVAFRCGLFAKPVVPTGGIGFSFLDFSLDLSVQYHNQLGVSFCCGLGWKFGKSIPLPLLPIP